MPKEENTKSKTEKIIEFLGGPSAVAGELGLEGILQIYNLLGIPLPFANGGAVGSPPVEVPEEQELKGSDMPAMPITDMPFYFNPETRDEMGMSPYARFAQSGSRMRDMVIPEEVGIALLGKYGNFTGGIQAPFVDRGLGDPQIQLMYQRSFKDGGLTSTTPPEQGPNPQGLATLFQKR